MRIIVVGAGKVGTSLTAQLIREHRVTVIDQEPKLIENIINVYDVMGVCGNGASYEVQKEAEVCKAVFAKCGTLPTVIFQILDGVLQSKPTVLRVLVHLEVCWEW